MATWFILSLGFTFGWIFRYVLPSSREQAMQRQLSALEEQLAGLVEQGNSINGFYKNKADELEGLSKALQDYVDDKLG